MRFYKVSFDDSINTNKKQQKTYSASHSEYLHISLDFNGFSALLPFVYDIVKISPAIWLVSLPAPNSSLKPHSL